MSARPKAQDQVRAKGRPPSQPQISQQHWIFTKDAEVNSVLADNLIELCGDLIEIIGIRMVLNSIVPWQERRE